MEKKTTHLLSDGSYIHNAVHSEHNCKYCRINVLGRCWKTRDRNKPREANTELPSAFRFPVRTSRCDCNVIDATSQHLKKAPQSRITLWNICQGGTVCISLLSPNLKMDCGSAGKHRSCPSYHDLMKIISGMLRFGSWQPHLITFYSKNVSGQACLLFSAYWKERKSEGNL